MGFFDKVMFWKKKDEFDMGGGLGSSNLGGADLGGNLSTGAGAGFGDFGTDTGYGQPQGYSQPPSGGFGNAGYPKNDFGMGAQQSQFQQQPFQQQQFMQQPAYNPNQANSPSMKDIEVVSSKLDALKAVLDSINQRLANLERIASGEYEPRRRW